MGVDEAGKKRSRLLNTGKPHPSTDGKASFDFSFSVGGSFTAQSTKLYQSQFFFGINNVFLSNVVPAFTNRTLKIKYLAVAFFSHVRDYTREYMCAQGFVDTRQT